MQQTDIKTRPILFSAPMVRAILEGRKVQTRRKMVIDIPVIPTGSIGYTAFTPPGCVSIRGDYYKDGGKEFGEWFLKCPYGKPGDRLYVRETFYAFGRWETRFNQKKGRDEWHFIDLTPEFGPYRYADNPPLAVGDNRGGGTYPTWCKRPSLFMPRAASRITLEITNVRAERLQEISEEDAVAEGVERQLFFDQDSGNYLNHFWNYAGPGHTSFATACASFQSLWQSINGLDSWDQNPWVWVVEFKKVDQ